MGKADVLVLTVFLLPLVSATAAPQHWTRRVLVGLPR